MSVYILLLSIINVVHGDFSNLQVNWKIYSGLSPIGESHEGILAKVQWTFANGESHRDILVKVQWTLANGRKS